MSGGGIGTLVTLFAIALVIGLGSFVVFMVYRNTLREAKNYERGLLKQILIPWSLAWRNNLFSTSMFPDKVETYSQSAF